MFHLVLETRKAAHSLDSGLLVLVFLLLFRLHLTVTWCFKVPVNLFTIRFHEVIVRISKEFRLLLAFDFVSIVIKLLYSRVLIGVKLRTWVSCLIPIYYYF